MTDLRVAVIAPAGSGKSTCAGIIEDEARRRGLSVARVKLATPLYDLQAEGPSVWTRFNAGPDDQLWWISNLATTYADHAAAGRVPQARADELARLVVQMRELTPGG